MFSRFSDYSMYSNHTNEARKKIRNRILGMIFNPIRIIWSIVPVLIVLNICGVTNISWILLGALLIGYELIDGLTDILAVIINEYDNKKERQKWEEKARKEAVKRMERKEEEDEE